MLDIRLLNEKPVEPVALLSRKKTDGYLKVKVGFVEDVGKVPLDEYCTRGQIVTFLYRQDH